MRLTMLLSTFLFLLMLGSWSADVNAEQRQASQPKCGSVSPRGATPRVIGGYQSEEFNWPFLAYLRIEYSLSVGNKTIQRLAAQCTSTILSGKYLLTAAHCFHAKAGNAIVPSERTIVTTGSANISSDEAIKVEAAKIHLHPEYSLHTHLNDIAIVELPTLLNYTARTRHICIASSFSEVNGEMGYVAGWGMHDADNGTLVKSDGQLRENIVPFADPIYCERYTRTSQGAIIVRKGTHLCAGGRNRGTGPGDSGGPLLMNRKGTWYQVGITSFGISGQILDQYNNPAVYTRVSAYCDFIKTTTKDAVACSP